MKQFIVKIALVALAFTTGFGFDYATTYALAEESPVVEEVVVEDVVQDTPDVPENDIQTPSTDENANTEEKPETEETPENTENKEHTFDDFLAWAEQEAERYGYGDKYTAAIEAIRTAATKKQVTLSTISSLLFMVAVVAYTIYKKVTDKKFKDAVANLAGSLNAQIEKLKELVDGTNNNTKTEEEIKAEEAALREELQKTNAALANLINGFMHFTDGVAMKDTKKAEVQRDCTKALQNIDGGVKVHENNKV